MFYVYLLLSKKDNKFYIGLTRDLKKRLKEHNAGKNKSTCYRKPLELIYFEAYKDKIDAQKREVFLKSGSGHRYIKKQLNNYLKLY